MYRRGGDPKMTSKCYQLDLKLYRYRGGGPCAAFIYLFGTWFGAAFACYEYIRTNAARMQRAALAAS